MLEIFAEHRPDIAVNLAAQAGVRYSLENPDAYIQSNIVGFFNILEACRHYPVEHLVFASSSSVYGANEKTPFAETDFVDHPVSLYAATKKSNELMAYTYSHLYRIPATGAAVLHRLWADGAPRHGLLQLHAEIFRGANRSGSITTADFEHDLYRDFTYIDDIVDGIHKLLSCPPPGGAQAPCRIFNIGNNRPEKLMVFIETLERCLSRATGRPVVFDKIFEPLKQGDVPTTYAATDRLEAATGFRPSTPIEAGLQKFADWYVGYYQVK